MKVLVLNCGSSSIKYELFDMRDSLSLASGLLEQIGESDSRLLHRWQNAEGHVTEIQSTSPVANHQQGMAAISKVLDETGLVRGAGELFAVGHRLAHGGQTFAEPTLIDQHVLAALRELSPLAPLHTPAMVLGIEVAMASFPQVPQVAVFDTAFHQSIPRHAFHYAIPREIYETYHVRRYGFHGTSHRYVAKRAAQYLQQPLSSLNLISLHLGNGASVTAIRGGISVDTSMGFTPLGGLVMGTRCGDIDPSMVFRLSEMTGWSNERIESMLNKESGLKGICGVNDMRDVLQAAESGDDLAELAIDIYTYRIKKYIGAYFAVLGCVDALVFTAGIGENAPPVRVRSCQGLENLGIVIDPVRNDRRADEAFEVQADSSSVKVLVVPTDEELEIAEQTVECLKSAG
jgi:acetate kinase